MSEIDFLQEVSTDVIPADKNLRFVNWFVDTIVFYLLLILIVIILLLIAPQSMADTGGGATLFQYAIGFIIFIGYFGLVEGITKGKSLGKFLTRTRAVKVDGSAFTFSDAFKRGLSRAVPFEPFSAFGDRPWHDKWTDTVVIKEHKEY